jgi:hypothetical protein
MGDSSQYRQGIGAWMMSAMLSHLKYLTIYGINEIERFLHIPHEILIIVDAMRSHEEHHKL